MNNWEEKYKNVIGEKSNKEKKQLRIAIIFFILFLSVLWTMALYAQNDTIRGTIREVDYTIQDEIHLTVYNNETGELLNIKTPEYIRLQKEFWIVNGENIIPPPLHVTDVWTEDNIIYFTTSEPVRDIVIWLREHRWDGVPLPTDHEQWKWASQSISNSKGYITTHSYGIPREFLGINWSWDMVIGITNQRGETSESEMIRFKTNGKMFQY